MFPGVLHRRVPAVTACFYSVFKIAGGIRHLLPDALDSVFEAAPDVDTGPFGRVSGPPFPTTDPVGPGKFSRDEVEFLAQSIRLAEVAQRFGFLESLPEFGDASLIVGACLVVEQRARIAAFGCCRCVRGTDEVEYMNISVGCADEPSEDL